MGEDMAKGAANIVGRFIIAINLGAKMAQSTNSKMGRTTAELKQLLQH
jgi:hypothetical protein